MRGLFKNLCLVPLVVVSLFVGPAFADEELDYRVIYRGVFSAGAKIPIADVSLQTRRPGGGTAYLESKLGVTSAAYAHVEAFYPIRYRFRSWYLADLSTCLASEYFEQKPNAGVKHKLIYLDDPEEPFVTRNLVLDGELDLPRLLSGDYQPAVDLSAKAGRFDRLGLLQRMRALVLQPGMLIKTQVSNGKDLFEYRVSVEKRETIQAAGRDWQAWRLRFDGITQDRLGREKHAHRPVFIWLSDDALRLPLLAVSRQALGKFYVELVSVPGNSQVAQLSVR